MKLIQKLSNSVLLNPNSLVSIADFGTMHDPWVYGSSNPFSARVAHILPSNAAVAAAGDCGATPSALPVPGKGSKATHCTG